jgi:hypothetical protein
MTFYEARVRWSLMANDPFADIEGLFFDAPRPEGDCGQRGQTGAERPCMRARLSRKRRQIEIARVVRSREADTDDLTTVGEWTTRTLAVDTRDGTWALALRENLIPEEEQGVRETLGFLRLCETMEDEDGLCSPLS